MKKPTQEEVDAFHAAVREDERRDLIYQVDIALDRAFPDSLDDLTAKTLVEALEARGLAVVRAEEVGR